MTVTVAFQQCMQGSLSYFEGGGFVFAAMRLEVWTPRWSAVSERHHWCRQPVWMRREKGSQQRSLVYLRTAGGLEWAPLLPQCVCLLLGSLRGPHGSLEDETHRHTHSAQGLTMMYCLGVLRSLLSTTRCQESAVTQADTAGVQVQRNYDQVPVHHMLLLCQKQCRSAASGAQFPKTPGPRC